MKTTQLILLLALAGISTALAVDPPPGGGYPDQNTALGEDALFSLTPGIDTEGRLGTVTSSARYKERVKPMNNASEAILSLRPVTFRYKKDLDSLGIPQFGLVAERVTKVNPDLVALDDSGKPYTVRYEAVNAMLLNEFLKEHKKVESRGQEIAELKAVLARQELALKQVSARLDLQRPNSRLAENR